MEMALEMAVTAYILAEEGVVVWSAGAAGISGGRSWAEREPCAVAAEGARRAREACREVERAEAV